METADGQWEEFTVMGIGKAPNLGGDSASFYFPQELLPMMKENVSNFNITCIVDVERDQLTEVENKIFQLAENRGGIEVFSISDIITYLQEEMDNIKCRYTDWYFSLLFWANQPYQHANDKHYIKTAGIWYFTVCGIEQ